MVVPCCCCFSNNVRHLALVAAAVAVAILYNNLVLFNFTAVLHPDLHPNLKPVASLDSLHEYSTWHDRKRRSYNFTAPEKDQIYYTEEEGHPILPSTKSLPTTTTTTTTTTPKPTTPKVLFFSNSPTAKWTTRIVRSTWGTTSTTKAATTSTTTTTTTTTTTEAPTTRNVVAEEVQRALDKLKKQEEADADGSKAAEKYPYDPKKVTDDIGKSPAMFDEKPAALYDNNFVPRSLLYAAPGIGCLLGTLPAMLLIRMLGVRYTLTTCLVVSALLQIIIPFLVKLGFPALFPIRILLGVCFSVSLPAAGALAATWGTLKEQLSFISTIFVFIVAAPIFSWPMTMLLYSNEVNLMWIYIAHAIFALVAALIFFIFYRDQPQDHPWVNGIELNRVVAGKVRDLKTNRAASAPCTVLFRSLSAWSIWIAAVGFFSALALLITFLPSFLSCQQVFMVDHLGAYSVLPYFFVPVFFVVGGLINLLSCSSSSTHVKINNTIGFVVSALFLVAIPVVFFGGSENNSIAIPLLLLSIAPLGFVVAGFLRSATLVGRGFAQHIVSCLGLSFGIAFSSMPFIVNSFVKENTLKEWLNPFLITAAILVITAIVFAVFGRGSSAGWAENTWDPLVRTKMLTTDPIDVSADECGLYEMRLIPKGEKR